MEREQKNIVKGNSFKVEGQIVDIHRREIYEGVVTVEDGVIAHIERMAIEGGQGYIMPGFVDSHIHVESSMLTPEEFGREAARWGTVAIVTDPHEIANVMGVEGVEFMRESARRSPIKSFFTIPSCVPATKYDVAGGVVTLEDVERMAQSGDYVALSEMMDIGGVLGGESEVISKIEVALRNGLPVDGHAPMLSSDALQCYADYGITTDHESTTIEEAREKIEQEMKILIREGSACEDYDTLKSLIASHPTEVMFCSDDLHADDLCERGHINHIVERAVRDGFDLFDVLRVASANVVEHYDLGVGTLQEGDVADFIVVEDLERFRTLKLFVDGELKYDALGSASGTFSETFSESISETFSESTKEVSFNNFCHRKIEADSLRKSVAGEQTAIEIIPGEIVTNKDIYHPKTSCDNLESDLECDLLKIVYINRYNDGEPQMGYCRGFGLKRGAIASTISHDSHNIIAVGCSDAELSMAINSLIESQGGVVVCDGSHLTQLPLSIGGIMSAEPCHEVAHKYKRICEAARGLGSTLHAPFMTLSFMSLCVIPSIKIGERGLFDVDTNSWVEDVISQ